MIAGHTTDSAAVTGTYVSSGSGNVLQDISVTCNTICDTGSGGAIVVSNTDTGRIGSVVVSGNLIRAAGAPTRSSASGRRRWRTETSAEPPDRPRQTLRVARPRGPRGKEGRDPGNWTFDRATFVERCTS
ncbi:hypothetical protein LRD69_20270 [Streptomyces sp. JH14]|uniref:hypothetical protein n=1 Tax=Streptomyces sp. JH14 TaxID=2793630 RepID=UPI0023F8CA11|nr:hypothetical protein [Streptomyces sp. JH14]MDF6044431.1 hypothetical protein [Streptomyces sp. JH14]